MEEEEEEEEGGGGEEEVGREEGRGERQDRREEDEDLLDKELEEDLCHLWDASMNGVRIPTSLSLNHSPTYICSYSRDILRAKRVNFYSGKSKL